MTEEEITAMAQRVVKAYFVDIAKNGPIDIFDFTDSVMGRAGADMSRCTEVDKQAILIIQQVARDLL